MYYIYVSTCQTITFSRLLETSVLGNPTGPGVKLCHSRAVSSVIIWSCYHIWSCLSSLKLLPCLHVQIICPFSFLSLFKSSNPGNVALSHSFRVPRCVSFHSIQFTALFEQIVSVFWWQFGNMWNLNFYEMAKEERVSIYQYIWQTIYCNIQAFRVNI